MLKWNFPIIADIYKDVIRNFIRKSTDKFLKDEYTKVSTFAGHWYEGLFFTKSLEHKSIQVSYCSMNNSELKLKFEHCEVIGGFEPKANHYQDSKRHRQLLTNLLSRPHLVWLHRM